MEEKENYLRIVERLDKSLQISVFFYKITL